MHLIGLDVGTTRCKALVFDAAGQVLGDGAREYGVICDAPAKAEQDAEQVWSSSKQALREAIIRSGVKEVAALSLSVQGDAIIPVDQDFRALHPAILGMDYRSKSQTSLCEHLFGALELFQRTGMRPHPMNALTKVLLLRELAPKVFESAARIVTYGDYILGKLGGEAVIDHSMASRTMAFNLHDKRWDTSILRKLDLAERLWSNPVPSGTVVGKIRRACAEELGLTSEFLLVTGGHDQTCAAIGAGAIREGIGVVSTGTAEVLSAPLRQPHVSRLMFDSFYPCYLHARNGQYFTFSLNHIGGILLKWWRDNFAHEEVKDAAGLGVSAYALMDKRMPESPSPVMVLPHLNGSGTPVCDLNAKGAIVGLTLATTRHDIAKAILEGLTFELRTNVQALAACGVVVNELRAVGGGAGSARWLQLKADILNRPIRALRCQEAACQGAAMLAGVAAGIWKTLDEAVEQTVGFSEEFVPRPEIAAAYAERYSTYTQLYPALSGVSDER